MGNAKAKFLRNEYLGVNYDEIVSHSDSFLGYYKIIKFRGEEKTLYLSKIMNPAEYDNYSSDVDEFAKKLLKCHPNICDFLFVEPNRADQNAYDLVFEFGDYLNTNFQNEKVIWTFINHMLSGLLFLQNEGLHYPVIRKKYTIYQSERNAFKLLNPYCFPKFIENVIAIYLNSNIGLAEKRNFQTQNIIRNIKEFGIMILALIKNVDESYFFKSPSNIRQSLTAFKREGCYSDKLINFLIYTIENRSLMNFSDLKKFISTDLVGASNEQYQNSYFNSMGPFHYNANEPNSLSPNMKSSLSSQPYSSQPKQYSSSQQNDIYSNKQIQPRTTDPSAKYESDKRITQQNSNILTPRTTPSLENNSLASSQTSSVTNLKQSDISQSSQPKKKIKRIVMRWSKETNSHKEFIEYEDGTSEEKNAKSAEESKKMIDTYASQQPNPSQYGPPPTQTPQTAQIPPNHDPKKSIMAHYDIKPTASAKPTFPAHTTWNIILFSEDNSEPAKLILSANIKEKYMKYNFMKNIIDRKNTLKPSVYHTVDGFTAPPLDKEQMGGQPINGGGQYGGYPIRSLETHPFTVQR